MYKLLSFLPEIYFFLSITIVLCFCIIYNLSSVLKYPNVYINITYLSLIVLLYTLLLFLNNSMFLDFLVLYNNQSNIVISELIILVMIVIFLVGISYNFFWNINNFEYVLFLLISLGSFFIFLKTLNILFLYIILELQSILISILISIKKYNRYSIESSIKYFILGSFSSLILFYGFSIIYGCTGFISLNDMNMLFIFFEEMNFNNYLVYFSVKCASIFILLGLLFKVYSSPFNFWLPDIYEGGPTSTIIYISTTQYLLMIFFFLKIYYYLLFDFIKFKQLIIYIISVLTLFFGAMGTLVQRKIKKFISFSTVTVSGFSMQKNINSYLYNNNIFSVRYICNRSIFYNVKRNYCTNYKIKKKNNSFNNTLFSFLIIFYLICIYIFILYILYNSFFIEGNFFYIKESLTDIFVKDFYISKLPSFENNETLNILIKKINRYPIYINLIVYILLFIYLLNLMYHLFGWLLVLISFSELILTVLHIFFVFFFIFLETIFKKIFNIIKNFFTLSFTTLTFERKELYTSFKTNTTDIPIPEEENIWVKDKVYDLNIPLPEGDIWERNKPIYDFNITITDFSFKTSNLFIQKYLEHTGSTSTTSSTLNTPPITPTIPTPNDYISSGSWNSFFLGILFSLIVWLLLSKHTIVLKFLQKYTYKEISETSSETSSFRITIILKKIDGLLDECFLSLFKYLGLEKFLYFMKATFNLNRNWLFTTTIIGLVFPSVGAMLKRPLTWAEEVFLNFINLIRSFLNTLFKQSLKNLNKEHKYLFLKLWNGLPPLQANPEYKPKNKKMILTKPFLNLRRFRVRLKFFLTRKIKRWLRKKKLFKILKSFFR